MCGQHKERNNYITKCNWLTVTDRWYAVDASKRDGRRVDADVRFRSAAAAVQSAARAAAIYWRHPAHRRARRRVHQLVIVIVEIRPQVFLSRHLTINKEQ